MSDPKRTTDDPRVSLQPDKHPEGDKQDTTPAQERGERLDTGRAIARGGKEDGPVPGAEPSKGQ